MNSCVCACECLCCVCACKSVCNRVCVCVVCLGLFVIVGLLFLLLGCCFLQVSNVIVFMYVVDFAYMTFKLQ